MRTLQSIRGYFQVMRSEAPRPDPSSLIKYPMAPMAAWGWASSPGSRSSSPWGNRASSPWGKLRSGVAVASTARPRCRHQPPLRTILRSRRVFWRFGVPCWLTPSQVSCCQWRLGEVPPPTHLPSSSSHGLVSPIWKDRKSITRGSGANLSTFEVKLISQPESDRDSLRTFLVSPGMRPLHVCVNTTHINNHITTNTSKPTSSFPLRFTGLQIAPKTKTSVLTCLWLYADLRRTSRSPPPQPPQRRKLRGTGCPPCRCAQSSRC